MENSSIAARFLQSLHAVTNAALYAAVLALGFMVASQVFEIVARYFFAAPTGWAKDTVGYLLLASVFLAMPTVTKERGHVAIDFVADQLPARRQRFAAVFIALAGAIACLLAGVFAAAETVKQATWGVQTVAAFAVPKSMLTAVVAFGFLLSSAHFALHALSDKDVAQGGRL